MSEISGTDRQILGRFGEDQAVDYLTLKGYRILKRNFRCRLGEIDIIASKENTLVFAEVKLRKDGRYGTPAEFVNGTKQRKLLLTAEYYMAFAETDLQPRFDIIEIYAPYGKNGRVTINHIENAFGC